MDEYLDAMNDDMLKALDAFKRDLGKVRTGRASPALLDGLQVNVESYGAVMPLNQLATITVPDPRMLVVTPWDKGTLRDVERAIQSAGLGLNPSNDGKIVRVPVPPLTQERRRDLVKVVRSSGEEAKVRLRHIRREYNDIFKNGESDGDLAQDDCERMLERVQKSTDDAVAKVDTMMADKEREVQEV